MTTPALHIDSIRNSLGHELGQSERVLWTASPDLSQVRRASRKQGLLQFAVLGICPFLVLIAHPGFKLLLLLFGVTHNPNPSSPLPMAGKLVCLLLIALLAWLFLDHIPRRHVKKALETLYAVTTSRVLIFRKFKDGRVSLDSFEPSHPMIVSRLEHPGGSGDIGICAPPSGVATAVFGIRLPAVPDPRAVERLIRRTFDPPRPTAPRPSS
jgi:hypothetical protein